MNATEPAIYPDQAHAVLIALESAVRERNSQPDANLDPLVALFEGTPKIATAAMRLAGAVKLESARKPLEDIAESHDRRP